MATQPVTTDIRDKRRLPSGQRRYNVVHLQDNHHKAIRLMLQGFNNKDIARELGLSNQQVSNIRNSPVVRHQLDILHGEADEEAKTAAARIKELVPEALDVMEDLMAHSIDTVRVRAAADILDRGGHRPATRVEGSVKHDHLMLTGDDLAAMKDDYRKEKANMVEAVSVKVEEPDGSSEAAGTTSTE